MSSRAVTTRSEATARPAGTPPGRLDHGVRQRTRRSRVVTSMLAQGEPLMWLTGGGLVLCCVMIVGLLGLVFYEGFRTFWPQPVESFELVDGQTYWGEVSRSEEFSPEPSLLENLDPAAAEAARAEMAEHEGELRRHLVRTGNFDLTSEHFNWVSDYELVDGQPTRPEWAIVIERLSWGRFYGQPVAFLEDGDVVVEGADAVWDRYRAEHPVVRDRYDRMRHLETHAMARLNHRVEQARLERRQAELDHGLDSPEWRAADAAARQVEEETAQQFADLTDEIEALRAENARQAMRLETATGQTAEISLGEIVRAYPANQVSTWDKISLYASRWSEFLTDEPREANSEGGVYPAIFGTVVMTLIMSLLVVPFGVLAALYLREYAKAGTMVSAVRISINNLAGVPSIVFGVFGLGFFSYIIGGAMDQAFFAAKLPSPTYGTGGLLWASLTLALLTLPVVIVATEEALAAVPNSMREGSYACGASKWQTIQRIVLPRAMPGIMTGTILAMARGAGEVAPLMLVGAVKLAPELPIDGIPPFIHPERSFMHLGFHIYDLGFQSQNSEAAKPMVFTTTLLLILIITGLNLAAIWLRTRLRRKFVANQF
ncbi:phosphate ABC transporter permease PstA [bacterium]|nr:phosphate ABC transporter permease PstA [bacterium]